MQAAWDPQPRSSSLLVAMAALGWMALALGAAGLAANTSRGLWAEIHADLCGACLADRFAPLLEVPARPRVGDCRGVPCGRSLVSRLFLAITS